MTKLGLIGISKIVTIYAYSSIGANSSQLALNVENLVPNFGYAKMVQLAHLWHY
jgi:hypothetical protein